MLLLLGEVGGTDEYDLIEATRVGIRGSQFVSPACAIWQMWARPYLLQTREQKHSAGLERDKERAPSTQAFIVNALCSSCVV